MIMIREKNLFFSYAGRSDTFFERFAPCCPIHNGQTHRETFTDRLYNELNRRISVYKMEDNYTGDIDSFRRKIADSRYVIIVLSHKYLMSPQCMIEWHEIHSREDLTSKSIWYIIYDEEQVETKEGKHKYDIPTFDFLYADKQYYDELIVPTWRNWTKKYPKTMAGALVSKVYETDCFRADYEKMRDVMSKLDRVSFLTSQYSGEKIDSLVLKIVDEIVKNESDQDEYAKSPFTKAIYVFGYNMNIDLSKLNFRVDFPTFLNGQKEVKYFGRKQQCQDLYNEFFLNNKGLVSLVAIGGAGKTFFAHKYENENTDKYDGMHHIILDGRIKVDFVEKMRRFVNSREFTDRVREESDVDYQIENIVEVMKNIPGRNLLVVDINVHDFDEFNTNFLQMLEGLKSNWHILVLSRIPFEKMPRDFCRMDLTGFETNEEQDEAVEMFRYISDVNDAECSDERLKEIFGSAGFCYHPLLISVLAIYCKGKTEKVDFNSVEKLLDSIRSKYQKLPGYMNVSADSVYDYLNLLVDFDSYGEDCEIILRHFILWEYNNIPYEAIKLMLEGYDIVDLDNRLADLVNNLILINNDKEYRRHGLTVEDMCDIYNYSNGEEKYIYDKNKDEELRGILELKGYRFKYFNGYRLHGMLGDTLRNKAREEIKYGNPYDYSIFIENIRKMLIAPKKMDRFRSVHKSIIECLFKYNEILGAPDDVYLLIPQHYNYIPNPTSKELVLLWSHNLIEGFVVDYNNSYCYIDSLATAIHDNACVLLNQRKNDEAKPFCEKVIKIRKKLLERLRAESKFDNLTKYALELCTLGIVLHRSFKEREAEDCFKDSFDVLSSNFNDLEHKVMLYQMLVVYRQQCNTNSMVDFEHKLKLELFSDPNSNHRFSPEPYFVEVKAGMFTMGAADDDPDSYVDEKPMYHAFMEGFKIGQFPITQLQWDCVMGDETPSYVRVKYCKGLGPDYPMYNITLDEVKTFLMRINLLFHRGQLLYSLPTEAQWEYAARGGHITSDEEKRKKKLSGVNALSEINNVAWYDGNSDAKTHPVGEKLPNELGLYDMSGNVLEWCQDGYDKNFYQRCSNIPALVSNPYNDDDGFSRVLRGGCWDSSARSCRVSNRCHNRPGSRYNLAFGFRLVLISQTNKINNISSTNLE